MTNYKKIFHLTEKLLQKEKFLSNAQKLYAVDFGNILIHVSYYAVNYCSTAGKEHIIIILAERFTSIFTINNIF